MVSYNWVSGSTVPPGPGGGGLCYCSGTIVNNLISQNSAVGGGGGLGGCEYTEIVNNTIVGNSSGWAGGGMWGTRGITRNCIIWGNTAPAGAQVGGSDTPSYSCIQDWTGGGTGNISGDPLFTTGPLGPYYLSQTAAGQAVQSPCVDAGSTTALAAGLANRTTRTDHRSDVGIVDMGYHHPPTPILPPAVAVEPPSLHVQVTVGTELATRTLEIRNFGGGTLAYTLVTSPTQMIGVQPTSGTSTGQVNQHLVTIHTRDLPVGNYLWRVTVRWSGGDEHVAVFLQVLAPPLLGPPNLVLSSVDIAPIAPAQVRPGDPIILAAFIENIGGNDARPFWTEVWGSRTGGLTLDRFLATSLRLPGGLPAGGSYSWVTTSSLSSIPDGPYTVVYAVDRPRQVAESNERDNRAVVRGKRLLVIRPQTQVDLAVEGFAMSPNPASTGQSVTFSGRVINRGSQPSGPFWIEFWGSGSWPYPTLDFFLCDSIFVPNLDAGAVVDLAAYPRPLYRVPSGMFQVGCVVDRDDSINELDETNNYQFRDGQVFNYSTRMRRDSQLLFGPDIAIVSAEISPVAPVQLAPGDTITLTVELANLGSTHTGSFWLEFWGSRDGGLTLHDFLTVSDWITNLAPGATVRLSSAKPLWGIPDGPYSIVAVADRPGDVAKTDESNNRHVVSGKRLLVIRPPTGANLVIEGFWFDSSPATHTPLRGFVRNTGTSDSGPFWVEFWACPGDPDYPWPDRFVCDSIHVDNLAPGWEEIALSPLLRPLYEIPTGQYVVIGSIDRLDQVAETDETDNYAIVRGVNISPH